MNWQTIINRFNFFRASNAEAEPKDSITSPLQLPQDGTGNDVNFQNALELLGTEDGIGGAHFGNVNYLSWVSQAEKSKDDRIRLYREMEQNPYVSEGLDEITYSSINTDKDDNAINLVIKNKILDSNDNMKDNLVAEFNYITSKIIDYKGVFHEWFKDYVLTGELAVELLVPNDDGALRDKGVIGVKKLVSEEYVTSHNSVGDLEGFVIRNLWDDSSRMVADANQIAYIDSGRYDYVNGMGPSWAKDYIPRKEKGDMVRIARSFIDSARKPFKQLDALEDSLVIYRLSRAPERLIFNVATGNLPKNKAEQFLQKAMNKYRKILTYNANTGMVDQAQNVKNITEDYWFAKDNTGKGTDVTTLQSGQNLGEIEDVQFFVQKLYKAMRVPYARFTGESTFEQVAGMSRDEIKFEKFIYGIVMRFSGLVKKIFKQHLIMKGIWSHYDMNDHDIDCAVVPPSYFTYMKNAEVLEAQFSRFGNYVNNVDVETPLFSKKMALKDGLDWDDSKIKLNEKWLKEEAAENAEGGEGGDGEEGEDIDDVDVGGLEL